MAFVERIMRPGGPVEAGGWTIKRYELTLDGAPVDAEVRAAAERVLPSLLPAGLDNQALAGVGDGTPRCGFSVLHQGKQAIWLNVNSWCYGDAVHTRLASAPLAEPTGFAVVTEPLIGCVWELAAHVHERSAWVRRVLTPDTPDVDGYLMDVLPAGPVGGP